MVHTVSVRHKIGIKIISNYGNIFQKKKIRMVVLKDELYKVIYYTFYLIIYLAIIHMKRKNIFNLN